MAKWYLGSMGFGWKDWVGPFYPPHLDNQGFLSHYAKIFNAVEIDSTFYGIPRANVVDRWAGAVPDGFQICAKTPRVITHDLVLRGARQEMTDFLTVIRRLGDRLGVILLQFPPSFVAEQMSVLEAFLDTLPPDIRFAVEVRHPSWYVDGNQEVLEAILRRRGFAWAATEYENLPMKILPTADYMYVRWIGQHGRFDAHTHEQIDVSQQLDWWKEHLAPYLDRVEAIYGFFNNDYAGFSPASVNRFKEQMGLPSTAFTPPQQGRLF